MTKLAGGCLCGEIRYEIIEDSSKWFSYSCHCRDCQYITGGSPNPVIYIPKAITLTKGKPFSYNSLSAEGIKVTRYFCGNCGTHIYGESEKYPETTVIKVGTLDDPSIFKSEMNVWVSSSQPWQFIGPDLPKSDKAPS